MLVKNILSLMNYAVIFLIILVLLIIITTKKYCAEIEAGKKDN